MITAGAAQPTLDHPRPIPAPAVAIRRVRRHSQQRSVRVGIVLAAAIVVVTCVSISVGDVPIPLRDVVPAIFGAGGPEADFIVRELRLPRALTGIMVGAAFGLSGAIFQSLARNPLASPDIIGITAGASAAAVFVIVALAGSAAMVSFGALVGGLLAALAIYLLAWKQGVSAHRLVLVGIGVSAMLASVTAYLLTRAEIYDAQRAAVWLTGSLNGRGWEQVRPVGLTLVVLLPAVLALVRPLRILQLGVPAALGGALLVLLADLIARRAFAPIELPVGVVTGVLGAPYLRWLLARSNRVGEADVVDVAGTIPVTDPTGHPRLVAEHLRLAYDHLEVAADLSVVIPPGRITAVVGANACGKSTLLRALARLLKPKRGLVLLDGESIHRRSTKDVATRLGILPQAPTAPEGISVADLVSRGRYPHQSWMRQWTRADEAIIADAMVATGTLDLAERSVDELSGGQRQRVWIAMALAQETRLLLLDEPTTYLDLAHQVEVLDLLADLNQHDDRTIVMVLHDLNHACRYAHHLIAIREGAVVAEGTPDEVITEPLVEAVFGLRCRVVPDPVAGTPMVVPIGRHLNVAVED